MTPRRHPTHGHGHQLYHLLRGFVASAAFLMLLLQTPLAVAGDEACPDISISTRYFPQVPKAGGHVTVTVRLTAPSAVAGPLQLVAHVPNGLDLVGKPRRPKGGGKGVAFYSQYDDSDDEYMLVWENIDLSSGNKPLTFRFRLKVEDCLPSEVFELHFLTLLMDGSCSELKTDLLKAQPKKHLSCPAGSDSSKALTATAASCSCNSSSVPPDKYALILSPGPQKKANWYTVDWGAYHITVSGYSITSDQKIKLKTALQLKNGELAFNKCNKVGWFPSINWADANQSNTSNPKPTYYYTPIKTKDGLWLDSAALCSLKQRLMHWADINTSPTINSTFKSKGQAPVLGGGCLFKNGNCPCINDVHKHISVPFPYHVSLATKSSDPLYSWNKIVKPDFNGTGSGSTKLSWFLYLNKEPSDCCQNCGLCDTEKANRGGLFWDKIMPCS